VDELLLVAADADARGTEEADGDLRQEPVQGRPPDEAVAIGAALYANSLEDNTNLRCSSSTSFPWPSGWRKRAASSYGVPAERGHPDAKAIEATTSYDGQTEVAMRIFQGDASHVSHTSCSATSSSAVEARKGRKGAARDHLRREHRGHPDHVGEDVETGKQMKTTVRVTQH